MATPRGHLSGTQLSDTVSSWPSFLKYRKCIFYKRKNLLVEQKGR